MPVWSVNNNTSLLVVFVFLCGSRARCALCLLPFVTLLNRGHIIIVQWGAAKLRWLHLRALGGQIYLWVALNLYLNGRTYHSNRLVLL